MLSIQDNLKEQKHDEARNALISLRKEVAGEYKDTFSTKITKLVD